MVYRERHGIPPPPFAALTGFESRYFVIMNAAFFMKRESTMLADVTPSALGRLITADMLADADLSLTREVMLIKYRYLRCCVKDEAAYADTMSAID